MRPPLKPKRKTTVIDTVGEDSEDEEDEDECSFMPPQIMTQPSESLRETPVMIDDVIELEPNEPATDP